MITCWEVLTVVDGDSNASGPAQEVGDGAWSSSARQGEETSACDCRELEQGHKLATRTLVRMYLSAASAAV